MNLTLFNFTKKKNSTKVPSSSVSQREFTNIHLKSGTDLVQPTFTISGVAVSTIDNYNYMLFLGRYYYITSCTSINNKIVELTGEIDPYATEATTIKNYNCFVTRSASNYDKDIYDSLLQPKVDIITNSRQESVATSFTKDEGSYVIDLYGKDGQHYFLTNNSFNLSSQTGEWFGAGSWFESLQYPPNQFLNSVKYLPFYRSELSYTSNSTRLGDTNIRVANSTEIRQKKVGEAQSKRLYLMNYDLDLSSLKTHLYYDDFRNYSENFTKVTVNAPFIGEFAVPSIVLKYNTLNFQYKIDCITGGTIFYCFASGGIPNNYEVMFGTCSVATEVSIGSSYNNTVGDLYKNTIATVPGIATNMMTGNGMGIAGNIGSLVLSQIRPHDSFNHIGQASGISSLWTSSIIVNVTQYGSTAITQTGETVDNTSFRQTCGRPLMQKKTLGDLSGYVEVMNPSISSNAYAPIIDMINTGLKEGIYIE